MQGTTPDAAALSRSGCSEPTFPHYVSALCFFNVAQRPEDQPELRLILSAVFTRLAFIECYWP
jgi:hypothetical protein